MSLTGKQTGRILLPLILFFVALQGFSQSKGTITQEGNIRKEGYIGFDHQKPWQVDFSYMRGGSPLTYPANELPEFSLRGGTTYVAKTVQLDGGPQRLYVEKMGDGAFYFLRRDGIFFKNADTLTQITEADLLPYLQSLSKGPEKWDQDLHLFRLKRRPLRYFAKHNGSGSSTTVPFASVGVFAGFNRSTLSTDGASFKGVKPGSVEASSMNISAGAFADIPVWPVRNLSLYAQGSYGKMRFNTSKNTPVLRHDVKADFDFLRLSVMPRYTLRSSRLRIFAQAGPTAFYSLKSESMALETATKGDNLWLNFGPGLPVSKRTMYGFEAGTGISFFYRPQHHLSFGISQAYIYGGDFLISNQSFTVSTNL